MTFFVYGLFDSGDWKECRYIGAASHLDRPLEHLNESNLKLNRYKRNWINKVLREDQHIGWKILECCDSWKETLDMEKWLVLSYKVSGHRLTNRTNGGDGVRLTPDILARRNNSIKASWQHRSRTWTCKTGMSGRSRGPMNSEIRAKISLSVKETMSRPEVKARHSAATKAALARPEVRIKHLVHLEKMRNFVIRRNQNQCER